MKSIKTTFTAAAGSADFTFWMLVWALAILDDAQRREEKRRKKRERDAAATPKRKPPAPCP